MAEQKLIGARSHGRTPPGTPTIKQRWVAARLSGDQTFDPGVECVNGHTSLRWSNSGICIECKRTSDNAYNAAHKEEHLARTRRSVAARPEAVKKYRAEYYRRHRPKAIARAGEWAAANHGRVLQTRRAGYARNAKYVRHKANLRHAANPLPGRAYRQKWKRNNPHRVRAYDSLRRARELGARAGDRRAYVAFLAWSQTAGRVPCYWCRRRTTPKKRHIDHIVPLAKGGADSVENLCVSCPPCNMKKGAKLPEEFSGQAEMAFV